MVTKVKKQGYNGSSSSNDSSEHPRATAMRNNKNKGVGSSTLSDDKKGKLKDGTNSQKGPYKGTNPLWGGRKKTEKKETTKKETTKGPSFKEAFAAARKKFIAGGGKASDYTFSWGGKKFHILRGDDKGGTLAEKKKNLLEAIKAGKKVRGS